MFSNYAQLVVYFPGDQSFSIRSSLYQTDKSEGGVNGRVYLTFTANGTGIATLVLIRTRPNSGRDGMENKYNPILFSARGLENKNLNSDKRCRKGEEFFK